MHLKKEKPKYTFLALLVLLTDCNHRWAFSLPVKGLQRGLPVVSLGRDKIPACSYGWALDLSGVPSARFCTVHSVVCRCPSDRPQPAKWPSPMCCCWQQHSFWNGKCVLTASQLGDLISFSAHLEVQNLLAKCWGQTGMQSSAHHLPLHHRVTCLSSHQQHNNFNCLDTVNSSSTGSSCFRIVIGIFFLHWNGLVCLAVLGNLESTSFLHRLQSPCRYCTPLQWRWDGAGGFAPQEPGSGFVPCASRRSWAADWVTWGDGEIPASVLEGVDWERRVRELINQSVLGVFQVSVCYTWTTSLL